MIGTSNALVSPELSGSHYEQEMDPNDFVSQVGSVPESHEGQGTKHDEDYSEVNIHTEYFRCFGGKEVEMEVS